MKEFHRCLKSRDTVPTIRGGETTKELIFAHKKYAVMHLSEWHNKKKPRAWHNKTVLTRTSMLYIHNVHHNKKHENLPKNSKQGAVGRYWKRGEGPSVFPSPQRNLPTVIFPYPPLIPLAPGCRGAPATNINELPSNDSVWAVRRIFRTLWKGWLNFRLLACILHKLTCTDITRNRVYVGDNGEISTFYVYVIDK